ncbi:pilus assembly FimT family protein [Deinococcus pimensis]|uniref:pilus assembly FimT family protein n=1 Tax=Deinococcus pimensis TaxID=309888 RepID=UPI0004B1EDE8|nr:prepilin-type N-terminal cleavage/methylation domain-containing protein [Deinococcus pimensis]
MRRGFTLVEFLVVMVAVGVLLAVGLPNFVSWRANVALSNAAQQLATDLHDARVTAKRSNTCRSVARTGDLTYVVRTYTNATCAGTPTDAERTMPATAKLTLGTVGSAASPAEVSFRPPYGATDGATVQFVLVSTVNTLRTTPTRTVRVTGPLGKVILK